MKILISGAGIAGSAAALFLGTGGHEVTVIDKAPSFRPLGYVLSLKFFGLGIVKAMGLLDELRALGIPYTTIQVHDAAGAVVQEYPAALAEKSTRGSLFLLRSDLHRVLHEAAECVAPARFGSSIESIRDDGAGVDITLSGGGSGRFDLVVIAEGLHSSSRALLWGDHGVRPFDVIYAATLVDGRHGVPDRVYQLYLAHGASLLVLPVNDQRLMIQCYFRGTLDNDAASAQVKNLLRDSCREFPPRMREMVAGIAETAYIFSDAVGMVTLPSLHRGQVVLLGDAGYCPTFLSGMGASLALLGARGLQQSIDRHPGDVATALAELDRVMQPVIAHYQHNALSNVELILSRSPLRQIAENWVMRLLPPALLAQKLGHQHHLEASLLEPFGPLEA